MKWIKQSLSLILVLGVALPAMALQSVPIVNQGQVTATLSTKGYNILRVNGDRLSQFISTDGTYQLSADPKNGVMYLKPATSKGTIHATITTETGRVFQVTFHVRHTRPQTIEFLPPESFKAQAKSWEEQTTYPTLLVDLVKAMVKGQSLEGYRLQRIMGKPEPLGRVATLTLTTLYRGAHLVGHVYQLTNLTQQSLQLTPEQLYRQHVRAVSLSSQVVPAKGHILVYEVVSRE